MKKLFVMAAVMAIIEPACVKADYISEYDEDTTYSTDVPEGYPLASAKYRRYEDCVAENPSDDVDCIMDEAGIIYAVAPFPTAEKTSSSWWRVEEAWTQLGTGTDVVALDSGKVLVYNPQKPIHGYVCKYEFRDYGDYRNCHDE